MNEDDLEYKRVDDPEVAKRPAIREHLRQFIERGF